MRVYVVKDHDFDHCEVMGVYLYKKTAEKVAEVYCWEVKELELDKNAIEFGEGYVPYAFYSFWMSPADAAMHRDKKCYRMNCPEIDFTKTPIVRPYGDHQEAYVWAKSEAEAHDLLYAALEKEIE